MRLKGKEKAGRGNDVQVMMTKVFLFLISALPTQPSLSQAFANFVKAVCHRAVPEVPLPSDEEIKLVFDTYSSHHAVIIALYALRTLIGAVIETLIVCDRALYLEEVLPESATKRIEVSALFDPLLSPRTFAILAIK